MHSCVHRDSSVPTVAPPPRLCLPLPLVAHTPPLAPVFTAASSVSTRGTLPIAPHPLASSSRPPAVPADAPARPPGVCGGSCQCVWGAEQRPPSLSLLSFWGSSPGWGRAEGAEQGSGSSRAPRGPLATGMALQLLSGAQSTPTYASRLRDDPGALRGPQRIAHGQHRSCPLRGRRRPAQQPLLTGTRSLPKQPVGPPRGPTAATPQSGRPWPALVGPPTPCTRH